MHIETYQIEVACGGLCRFLGRNELTPILSEEVYEKLNDMVIKRLGSMNMTFLLNSETRDIWKVLFIQAETSLNRPQYIFIRVAAEKE